MFIDANTSREDLQVAILNDAGLYARFDERRFLNDGYSNEELLSGIQQWIADGDECGQA